MALPNEDIVNRLLDAKLAEVEVIAGHMPPDHALYHTCLAFLAAHRSDAGLVPISEAKAAIAKAMQSPPPDPGLVSYLLRNQALFALYEHEIDEAERLLARLRRIAAKADQPRLTFDTAITQWRVSRARRDYEGQLAAIGQALAAADRLSSSSRIYAHITRFHTALENHDLPIAEAEVAALEPMAEKLVACRMLPLFVMRALLLDLIGRPREAMESLAQSPREQRTQLAKRIDLFQARLLMKLRRFDEADAIITRMSDAQQEGESLSNRFVSPVDVLCLRAEQAVYTGDKQRVWSLSEQLAAAARHSHPVWAEQAKTCLLQARLACRDVVLSRRILEELDADQRIGCYRGEWIRLLWLEGQTDQAAMCYARLLDIALPRYPEYVPEQFRLACEMSAFDMARLATMAQQYWQTPAAQQDVPGSPVNTLARRQRLRRLFERHLRLSRAQVVDALGCAPNTATSDLRTLEAEGFVRRVATSAHPRTGYYILAGK